MKKKLLLILASAMIFVLAGCESSMLYNGTNDDASRYAPTETVFPGATPDDPASPGTATDDAGTRPAGEAGTERDLTDMAKTRTPARM